MHWERGFKCHFPCHSSLCRWMKFYCQLMICKAMFRFKSFSLSCKRVCWWRMAAAGSAVAFRIVREEEWDSGKDLWQPLFLICISMLYGYFLQVWERWPKLHSTTDDDRLITSSSPTSVSSLNITFLGFACSEYRYPWARMTKHRLFCKAD